MTCIKCLFSFPLITLAMGMIAGLHANVTDHQPPAPLPEFKTPEQLARWRTEQNQKTQAAASSHEGGVFYTGKPYLAESSSYAFKYREYNPEMGRWTTVDPSGFPDGANNRVYLAAPISQLDNNGCQILGDLNEYSANVQYAAALWNALEVAAYGVRPLTYIAMTKAEQSGSSWINDSALNNAVKDSSLVTGRFSSDVSGWLHSNVSGNGNLGVNMTYLHNDLYEPGSYYFSSGDLSSAMHGVTFTVTGTISNYPNDSSGAWVYDATVSYSKLWTFENHYFDSNPSPENWIGIQLQKAGLIHSYSVAGSFNRQWVE